MLQIQRSSDANLSKATAEISVGQCSEETLQFLSSRNKPLSVPEGKQNIPLPPVARCIHVCGKWYAELLITNFIHDLLIYNFGDMVDNASCPHPPIK